MRSEHFENAKDSSMYVNDRIDPSSLPETSVNDKLGSVALQHSDIEDERGSPSSHSPKARLRKLQEGLEQKIKLMRTRPRTKEWQMQRIANLTPSALTPTVRQSYETMTATTVPSMAGIV